MVIQSQILQRRYDKQILLPSILLCLHPSLLRSRSGANEPLSIKSFFNSPTDYEFLFFRGHPVFLGWTVRCRRCSSWSKKRGEPQKRPVWVWRRMRSQASSASRPSCSQSAQSSITPVGGKLGANTSSWWIPQCAGALDQGYSSARPTIRARTGLHSIYRTAAHRCVSSSGED